MFICSCLIYGKENGIANEERRVVALTFDDGPCKKITPQVLQILKEKKVPATFFVIGEVAKENKSLIKKILDSGNEVGNHTFSHKNLCELPKEKAVAEIEKSQKIIEKISGERPFLYRAPFGKVKECVDTKELLHVGWNVDTLDWTGASIETIMRMVRKECKEGSIILMHDQYENTVKALPVIIDWVREQGYEFVSVEELLLGD